MYLLVGDGASCAGAGGLGIGADTARVVPLALMAASNEDTETVRAFFQNVRAHGPGDMVTVV